MVHAHALRLNVSKTNRANNIKTILNTITLASSILSFIPGLQILGVMSTLAMTAGGADSVVVGSSNIAQSSKGSNARKSAIKETISGAITAVAGAGLSYYSGMKLFKGPHAMGGLKPTAIKPSSAPLSISSKILKGASLTANVGLGGRGVYVMGKSIYDQEKYGDGIKGLKSDTWNERLSFANDMLAGVLGVQGLAMQGALLYKSYKISSQASIVKTSDTFDLDKGANPEENVGFDSFKDGDTDSPTATQFENPAFAHNDFEGSVSTNNPILFEAPPQEVPVSSIIGTEQHDLSISLITIGIARVFTGH